MTSYLRDSQPQDAATGGQAATITQVNDNGTVTIDLGGGQLVPNTVVILSYVPVIGAVVEVFNRDDTHWVVLGPRRVSNPPSQSYVAEWMVAYDVWPVPSGAANPLVVSAGATGSWRDVDGWGSSTLPTTDTVAQGAYTSRYGYYRGCYFYGAGAFSNYLQGKRCTRLRIRINRLGSGGLTGATQQVVGPHPHPSQPGGPPVFPWGAQNVGGLAWSANGTFDLPTFWGDLLITGQASGLGHLLLATGNGNYSFAAGKSVDGDTGLVTLDWA